MKLPIKLPCKSFAVPKVPAKKSNKTDKNSSSKGSYDE